MSLNYPNYGAWLHYYEKEELSKAYTEGLSPYIHHIKKFSGSLTLDRSIGWCDPLDVQKDADKLLFFTDVCRKRNPIYNQCALRR